MQPDKLEEYVIPPYRRPRTFYGTQEYFQYAREAFYRFVAQEQPKSILDVGCGTGFDAKPLMELGVEYMGVDPIPENLIYARKDNPDAEFDVAYAQELPFEDNSYDWTYMCGVWENMPDAKQAKLAIDECMRVAKKKVVALDATRRPRLMIERYMSVPMEYGLTIKRVNYDPRPDKLKANYMWIIDLEGIK